MSEERTVTRVPDAWANEERPKSNYGSTGVVRVKANKSSGHVLPPFPVEAIGETILFAELAGQVAPGWLAQTLTIGPHEKKWRAGQINWDNRPSVNFAQSVTLATSAMPNGGRVAVDLTTLAQTVADGQEWFGLRISSSTSANGQYFHSNESGEAAWEWTVVWSTEPDAATNLQPDGGSVGIAKPILSWEADGQIEFIVNIYADEEDLTPAWSSGWVTSTDTQLDLAGTSYPGGGAWWEITYRTTSGDTSLVSDRVEFTVDALPTPVLDAPTGGVVSSSQPTILAHLASGTVAAWQIVITGASRADVYADSGLRDGPVAWVVPERRNVGNSKQRVLAEDQTRQVGIFIWDDVDRAESTGAQTHVELWTTITWDEDAGVEAPSSLSVEQVGQTPLLRWSWERSSAARAWQFIIDGVLAWTVPADDVSVDAGRYSWVDDGRLAAYEPVEVRIRAEESDGDRSLRSGPTWPNEGRRVEGVWIIVDGEEPVVLAGLDFENPTRTDATATYVLQDGREVDYRYGLGGLSGNMTLTTDGEGPETYATLATLERIAARPYVAGSTRLVWASQSLAVRLRSLHGVPSASMLPPYNHDHIVRFGFIEDN